MKKVLALILSIALCFTVFAGCFATSAAAPDFSVSANGNVVTVSGTIAENSQYAVMLKITLDDDLTLASIADGNGTPLEAYAEDKETWHYVLDNTGKIISALELYNDTFTYVITVNAPANDSCEAPSDPYAVSVVADYADYNADAPTLEQYTGSANVVVPAKAHTPAEAVKENEVAAEVGKEGSYDNVVYCSACNTELSRENVKVPALEPEEPEEPEKPVLDENIKFMTTQMNISSTMDVLFRVKKSLSTDVYASCKVIVTAQKYNTSTLMKYTTKPTTIDLGSISPNNNGAYLRNVALYELDLSMTAYVVCYDAEGNQVAYSDSITVTPVDLLKNLYYDAATAGSANAACNVLITDILDLATEAQHYFVASSGLKNTDLEKATDINAGWTKPGSELDLDSMTSVDNNGAWNSASTITSTTNNFYALVDIAGAPVISYYVRRASETGAAPLDYNKLSLTVSYTTLFTQSGSPEVVTDTVTGDRWNDYVSGKHLYYKFEKAAMYDSNKTVTAVLTYDGTEVCTYVYSTDSFILKNYNVDGVADVTTALGRFNSSARAYYAAANPGKAV